MVRSAVFFGLVSLVSGFDFGPMNIIINYVNPGLINP